MIGCHKRISLYKLEDSVRSAYSPYVPLCAYYRYQYNIILCDLICSVVAATKYIIIVILLSPPPMTVSRNYQTRQYYIIIIIIYYRAHSNAIIGNAFAMYYISATFQTFRDSPARNVTRDGLVFQLLYFAFESRRCIFCCIHV